MSVKETFFCRAKTKRKRIELRSIVGDCLEGAGIIIPEGAVAVIDQDAEPKVGDLVHCNDEFCCINGFIKKVKKVGKVIRVGTEYTDSSKNYEFDVLEMYGVVLMVIDYDGQILYSRKNQ